MLSLKKAPSNTKTMLEKAKKYIIYARKSSESEDRQMASIDSQIRELKELATREGLNVIEVMTEAQSAKAPGRPVFNALLQKIRKQEADGIICWKLNRLARNPIDGGEIIWLLQTGVIAHIATQGRGHYPTDNVILLYVELGMANQFIRDLSTDAKRGLENKALAGWFPGKAPIGYLHNPLKKKGEKEVMCDPGKFEIVRKAFKGIASRLYTPPEAFRIATTEWGLTGRNNGRLSLSNWYSMLNNPFYFGEFEFPRGSGKWYHGRHKPMISQSEYLKIQAILGKKGTTRPKQYTFPYRGLLTCGSCGAMITAEHKTKRNKNGNVHCYIYYHCTKRRDPNCTEKVVEAQELERQIKEFLSEISIPASFVKWALKYLRETAPEEATAAVNFQKSLQQKDEALEKKLSKLIDLKLNELLSEEEYATKKQEILDEREGLKEVLKQPVAKSWLETLEETFSIAEDALKRFEEGEEDRQRELVGSLGSNLFIKSKKFAVEAKNPVLLMKKIAKPVQLISRRFEPPSNGLNEAQLWAEYARTNSLLRRQDSNL